MKSVIYYTCNTHRPEIDELCRQYLARVNLPIITVSLNKDLDFGDTRIVMHGERSPLMMHQQILAGLEACHTQYAFLIESDVLYHPSHFEFTPKRDDVFYFNVNVWKQRWPEHHYVWTDNCQQVSGMSASTSLLLNFFRTRVKEVDEKGFDRHYEPRGPRENYLSSVPNICIRHNHNLTQSKWSPQDYRNQKYAQGWKEATSVPGWPQI